MRKVFYIALILALGIGLNGCGEDKPKRTHHIEKVDHTDDVPMPQGSMMFSKEFEKTVENYIQTFIGSLIVAYAAIQLFDEPNNHGYWLFLGIGTFVILMAHWNYKKRQNGVKERR